MQMIEILRWIAAGLLALVFVGANVANLMLLFRRKADESDRSPSPVLLAGGIAGALALTVVPRESFHEFFWLPLLVDLGTGPFFALSLAIIAYQALKTGSWMRHVPFARYLLDPVAPTPRTPFSKERAIVGCILGTAVGDAMGLVYEGLSRQRQMRMFPEIEGYRFLFNKGMTSDDTEHTCMLAQALIESGNYRIDRLEKEFTSNFAWRLRFWLLGLPAGIGMATLKGILKLWIGFPGRLSGVRSAGNGPAMRCALIGVCYGENPAKMKLLVRAATRITHTDIDAEHGALAVALAAHCAATPGDTVSPAEYAHKLQELIGVDARFATLAQDVEESLARGESVAQYADRIGCGSGVTGYICHTVPVALHVWFAHPQNFRAAILSAIRLGGDTDTVAAIVGAIVGAGVGKEGIPAAWLANLCERPRTVAWMEMLGVTLAGHCDSNTIGGADSVGLLMLLTRNAIFMVLVLLHGFRRLLPPY